MSFRGVGHTMGVATALVLMMLFVAFTWKIITVIIIAAAVKVYTAWDHHRTKRAAYKSRQGLRRRDAGSRGRSIQ